MKGWTGVRVLLLPLHFGLNAVIMSCKVLIMPIRPEFVVWSCSGGSGRTHSDVSDQVMGTSALEGLPALRYAPICLQQ